MTNKVPIALVINKKLTREQPDMAAIRCSAWLGNLDYPKRLKTCLAQL